MSCGRLSWLLVSVLPHVKYLHIIIIVDVVVVVIIIPHLRSSIDRILVHALECTLNLMTSTDEYLQNSKEVSA